MSDTEGGNVVGEKSKAYPVGEMRRLTLKELPEDERPRERLLDKGPEALTDAELLAIIIRDGTRAESALDIARRLIAVYGSLRTLKDIQPSELCNIKGIGPARAAQIRAALALAGRIGDGVIRRGEPFRGSRSVFEHFHPRMRFMKKEQLCCILLDTKNRVQKEVELSTGGLSGAVVHPRDILRPAIAEAASAIMLIHNHPSGDVSPSRDDIHLTKRVKEVCELAGIRFLDHLIIGEETYASMADLGLI
jgi:DNA repair protein RadC